MHPYYGSNSLYGVSPTLIESVEAEEAQMNDTTNTGNENSGSASVPDLANGDLNLAPQNHPALQSTNHSGPHEMPDVVPPFPITQSRPATGLVLDRPTDLQRSSLPLYSSSYYPHYQSTPISAPHRVLGYPARPSVQFISPCAKNPAFSQSMASYSQPSVSFHFSSPTFSSPPVQMMAPKAECRRQPWHLTVPTSMPWASTGPMHNTSIQFTAASQGTNCTSSISNTMVMSSGTGHRKLSKRKSPYDGGLPEKVHINEEKMAARLEEMHLDNNNLQWHPDLEEQWYTQRQAPTTTTTTSPRSSRGRTRPDGCEDNDDTTTTKTDQQTLSASSHLNFTEMLKLGMKSREILPKVIMDEMLSDSRNVPCISRNKPNMQIVLWKPPGDFVQDVVRQVTKSSNLSHDDDDVNDMIECMDDMGENRDAIGRPVLDPTHSNMEQFRWFTQQNGQRGEREGSNDMEL